VHHFIFPFFFTNSHRFQGKNDGALRSKVQGKLRGVRAVKTHYFSDGGVSVDVEVPLDQLPVEIGQNLKPPAGATPPSTSPPDAGAK